MIGISCRMIRALKRFHGDQGGVSALEFALIAPVLIILYFGLAEVTQAVMAQRRAISTASAIGDLVAQASGSTTAAAVDDAMNMADIIMSPFPAGSQMSICIASITASTGANPIDTVAWRRMRYDDGTCPTVGSTVSGLSSDVIASGQSLIMAKVSYRYNSTSNLVLHANPTFSRTYYLRPRASTTITCSDC